MLLMKLLFTAQLVMAGHNVPAIHVFHLSE